MKTLEKRQVVRVNITSYQYENPEKNEDDPKVKTRQFLAGIFPLGVFPSGISKEDIEDTLDEHELWDKVLGTATLYGEHPYRIEIIPKQISEGKIFDDLDEFAEYLKKNVTYRDIQEGYQLAEEVQ